MNVDSAGLQVLTRTECVELLSSVPVGRIVFTDRALPAVQPVNFLVVDGHIVIRTGQGSKLAAAARDAVVAFEVDEFDAAMWTGWSVTVIGHARAVVDPQEVARLSLLPLIPWAPGERNQYVVVRIEDISGRRIRDGGL
ncbi:pyridoxamine 5'-phosphate oxidase family protein [Sinosporangium siamense]|uniref:Pyridoxamine 5'-phosphate oxidase n=1 Tax=Sinosporangium siamense TaxID=1367973 RepID=A0A919VBH5_9ACTN|nr:pyridoxamine 5'-phosphate oxidase family protein [Sinosporangium siamense]GII92119.1 pyridoxamine 5'-phosphate oxidase [Sinosporangium siamense]